MDANNQCFHAIQHAGFQHGPGFKDEVLDVQNFRKHTREVPDILEKVENVPVPIVKHQPQIK